MNYQNKNQTEIFIETEADGWFDRNFKNETKKNQDSDIALEFLLSNELKGKSILEVGCADGWRLSRLVDTGCKKCVGIDPSLKAIKAGMERFNDINLKVGTAANMNVGEEKFDIVVAGFCLYLCDRSELFKIAYEFDKVLNDGGIIVITDFISDAPYKNEYSHYDGLYSYKMDYSKLFSWNPEYSIVFQKNVGMHDLSIMNGDRDDRITLTVIKKQTEGAYPMRASID